MTETLTDVEYVEQAFFNVIEEPVHRRQLDPSKGFVTNEIDKFKLLVREDTDQPIAVVKQGYQIIQNRRIIEPMLEYLDKTDVRWEIDRENSCIDTDRLRLRIKYPDLNVEDDSDQGLNLGHSIHNSFDGNGSVKILEYLLRLVCTNGLTRWTTRNKIWFRHTKGFTYDEFNRILETLVIDAPVIGDRIRALQELEVNQTILCEARGLGTKGMHDYIEDRIQDVSQMNQWQLLNILTWFVSHNMKQRQMAEYQYKIGKLFNV